MTLLGLNFRTNDCVVTTNHEHNAIKSPLQILQQRTGIRVVTRLFPPAAVLRKMGATELLDTLFPNIPELRDATALCVSHVYPTTGVRLPLQALRERADALNIRYLVVDGAQALGMVDISDTGEHVSSCDFYAAPGHKWLNGPPSTGLLYIRNADIRPPEFYPTISQRMPKYSACDVSAQSCFPMAEALQIRGCSNTPGFAAMIRAMEYVDAAGGSAAIEKHILELSGDVKNTVLHQAPDNIVSPHSDSSLSSGLTTFFPFRWDKPRVPFTDKKTADWVVAALLRKNIQVRSIGFTDGANRTSHVIRVSTGYLNTADQVEIFKTALQEVLTHVR
jgi:selenocysteine lyase/cysteine desulfurase